MTLYGSLLTIYGSLLTLDVSLLTIYGSLLTLNGSLLTHTVLPQVPPRDSCDEARNRRQVPRSLHLCPPGIVGTREHINKTRRTHTQVLLAQNEWYRPTEQMSTQGTGQVHQSRVKMYTFQLHRWFCALQVSFPFFAFFLFPSSFFLFLFSFF